MPLIKEFSFDPKELNIQQQLDVVKNIFESNDLLKSNFSSIQVIHNNNLSTFVPKPFFKEENLADYLNYNLKVLQNDFVAHDPLNNGEIINVYIPYVHLNNYFFDKYGTFEYKHSSTILVESLLSIGSQNEEVQFYVHVETNQFQIVVLKRKKLLFYNSFNYKTKEDFIYYILFAAEQLNLNPEEFRLVLLGGIEKESELYKVVYDYVRNVAFYTQNHSNFILLNS